MPNKETFTLSQEEFYAVGDRNNLEFAIMIRAQMTLTANRRGFARRLLLAEGGGSAADGANFQMRFDPREYDRAQEMKDQIVEAQSEFFVSEDKKLFQYLRNNLPPSQIIHSTWESFNPSLIVSARNLITSKMVPVSAMAGHGDFWKRMVSNDDFVQMMEANIDSGAVMNGFMGSLFGASIQSDAFAHPSHKVFEKGEFFIFSSPENVGTLTTYGESDPIEIHRDANPIVWDIPHDFRIGHMNLENVALLKIE
jgi:hypothetical protein